jgi:hypothetical protein
MDTSTLPVVIEAAKPEPAARASELSHPPNPDVAPTVHTEPALPGASSSTGLIKEDTAVSSPSVTVEAAAPMSVSVERPPSVPGVQRSILVSRAISSLLPPVLRNPLRALSLHESLLPARFTYKVCAIPNRPEAYNDNLKW